MSFDNVVSITIDDGKTLQGFQTVRVTRGLENVPSSFELTITEKYPGYADIVAKPPSSIILTFGTDTILTGLIDSYGPSIGPNNHDVVIRGTSNFSFLTRASATLQRPPGWPQSHDFSNSTLGAQMIGQTVNQIATALCAPWPKIQVTGIDCETVVPVMQFNIGDKPYAIIENIARWAQLLVFDDVNGNLVFAQVGQTKMASGFQEGANIQVEAVTIDYSERFSDYVVFWTSTDTLRDQASALGVAPNNIHGYAGDSELQNLGIYKPNFIMSTQTMNGLDFGNQLATWYCNRAYGRSQAIRITCDSWRDTAGTLWAPNSIAVVNAPSCKIENASWIIAEVSFILNENGGTTAELIMMPPQAFAIEPVSLSPSDWDTAVALSQNTDVVQTATGDLNAVGDYVKGIVNPILGNQ
jgi:prophage tail gpP-like protein